MRDDHPRPIIAFIDESDDIVIENRAPAGLAIISKAACHARDNNFLDIRSTFNYLQRLGIAIKSLGRVFGRKSEGAKYFHRLICCMYGGFGCGEFGDGGFVLIGLALVF